MPKIIAATILIFLLPLLAGAEESWIGQKIF